MKLRFLTGLAVGYVFGTRAGRERYEQLAEQWREFTDSDMIQQLRGEFTKITSGGADSEHAEAGMVTPPVIVGPGPDGSTGTPVEAGVVLPDLEVSSAASIDGDTPAVSSAPPAPAKRRNPPPAG
jgi:hypothetical protein